MKRHLIIIVASIIVLLGIVGYFYLDYSQKPKQLVGEEILEVTLTINNGNPLSKIEVDLWKAGSKGAPDAGISYTDDKGLAIFNVPEGEYEIGFNSNNFPDNLIYPERTYVLVKKGVLAHKTIVIEVKQG